ncbi:hypothetical protein HPB47_016316 [Ixodes persulcatus]|uniref:Uncharacterized protein n=1 Tax=Ixodes persulcatus TaxID=34615 RepID=A0AC60R1K6_IXOPE|nr:hypothetical protein HPB47_016316 [Ixodes persulcatus]
MEANKASRVVMACALMMADEEVAEAPNTDSKKLWIKTWMSKKKPGIQNLLYQELLESDPVEYRRLLRVNSNHFADILSSIASCIQKLDTKLRPAIPAIDKLQLTLRFHASAGFCTLLSAHPGLMEMEAFGGRQHCETPSRTQQPDCRSLDLDRSASHPSS